MEAIDVRCWVDGWESRVDLGGSYVGCRGGDSSPPTPRVWSRVDLSCPEGSCRVRRPVLLLFPSLHGVIFVVDLFGGNREQRVGMSA
jgi:hypothetical protein